MNRDIVVIAHDIRSCYNIGTLFRTCEGLGVNKLILSGYSPYPETTNDSRLPHLVSKMSKQINKTALGTEAFLEWNHWESSIRSLILHLKRTGYVICALEQSATSIPINKYEPTDKIALIIGREVEGIRASILEQCDLILEIPMLGKKESHNVTQACAIALYRLRFLP